LVAVVACDMPFVNAGLLRFACEQLEDGDVAIPVGPGGLEPLHAVYRRVTCLPAIRAALDTGKWRVDAWFGAVRVRVLARPEYAHLDPQERSFVNVNTPEELALAEAWAQDPGV
jgi:molybdopterin-guanine dinucleotide biosynthesis protein A